MVTEATIADIANRSAAQRERLGKPLKIKPGRPIVLTLTTPSGEKATAILTPEDADGGQAARVLGAEVSYLPAAKA